MNTTKHTPGPWGAIKLNSAPLGAWAVNAPGYCGKAPLVCALEHSKSGPILHAESEANARLIAAAPDLLATLQELRESANYWSEYDVPLGIVDRIKAAIAKATGDTP